MNHPIRDYLPYVGHAMMGAGYLLEHLNTFRPPLPSGVVLIGHVFVLSDPQALSPQRPRLRVVNSIFFLSNLFVFVYDIVVALGGNDPGPRMVEAP